MLLYAEKNIFFLRTLRPTGKVPKSDHLHGDKLLTIIFASTATKLGRSPLIQSFIENPEGVDPYWRKILPIKNVGGVGVSAD
jgi:hypothetical protein